MWILMLLSTLAVAVVNAPMQNFTFRGHSEYFRVIELQRSRGVLLTRVAIADGRRLGSTVIDTRELAGLHGVRVTPVASYWWAGFSPRYDPTEAVGMRSLRWSGTMARPARTAPSMSSRRRIVRYFRVAQWAYIALGTTGYIQYPSGASISEAAQPLLVLLNTDGSLAQNLGYTGGARHNQLTTIAPLNGGWLLGGMINGPGTHSGDGDRALIVTDGFLREVNSPAE